MSASLSEKHPLDQLSLSQPLNLETLRCHFIAAFFNLNIDVLTLRATDNGLSSFFARYETLCILATNKQPLVHELTHGRLCEIRNLIKPGVTHRELCDDLQTGESLTFSFPSEVALTVLDLCGSVWLLMTIGYFPGDLSYDEPLVWERGPLYARSMDRVPQTLHHRRETVCIADALTFTPSYTIEESVKLPQTFTASSLERVAGIRIHWTSNLADHLLLGDDDTKLFIFHHASILQLHMASPTSPYPYDFLDETMRTLSLLLPPVLGAPNSFLLRAAKKHALDASMGNCRRLNSSERHIDRFVYWRDRLVLLKRTFDETEPRTIRQLWEDDRRKTQWFTFWVAVLVFIMTVFFGVVQSVGTWVQAWASVKALKK